MSVVPRHQVASPRPGRAADQQLPEGHTIKCGPLRLSKRGIWRASVLVLVHLIVVVHVVHWLVKGKTITPVEPSEAMQTLEMGYVNAGFILFIILILSTMILGRWFCGWACHVVAYQDLCGWVMKKVGMKPRPFRSRLLVFVPLLAAIYMFVWPSIIRMWEGRDFPALMWHMTTDSFWETFPGFWIALLTFLVCGFLIVYFLGNKGFCTYGCPYGAIFGKADLVALGKIRVTDACEGCGHCTATCSSNVRVHEEVKLYGMVVDSGCMKCMDCVSVCPKQALYYGFGKPSILKSKVKEKRAPKERRAPKRYDFTWPEEILMAGCFVLAFYAFRGLYDAVPFLLSVGLSSISAFLIMQTARLFYTPAIRLQSLQLRIGSKTTRSGWVIVSLGGLLAALILHSAVWQYHFNEGNRHLAHAQRLFEKPLGAQDPEAIKAAEQSLEHFRWSQKLGFFAVADLESKLGSIYQFLGRSELSERHLRRALVLKPDHAGTHYTLAKLLASQNRADAALAELQEAVKINPDLPGAAQDLAAAVAANGRPGQAIRLLRSTVRRQPQDLAARLNLGMLLADTGDLQAAKEEIQKAIAQRSDFAPAHYNLGLIFAEEGRRKEAVREFQESVRLDPDFAGAHFVLGNLAAELSQFDLAVRHLEKAKRLDPFNPEILRSWAGALRRSGRIQAAIRTAVRAPAGDLAAWYGVAFLYKAAGDERSAATHYNRVRARRPGLQAP